MTEIIYKRRSLGPSTAIEDVVRPDRAGFVPTRFRWPPRKLLVLPCFYGEDGVKPYGQTPVSFGVPAVKELA